MLQLFSFGYTLPVGHVGSAGKNWHWRGLIVPMASFGRCLSPIFGANLSSVHVISLAVFKHGLSVAALTTFVAKQKLKQMMDDSHIRSLRGCNVMINGYANIAVWQSGSQLRSFPFQNNTRWHQHWFSVYGPVSYQTLAAVIKEKLRVYKWGTEDQTN